MYRSEPYMAMSDDQLVIAMETGDRHAFEEIFERYWKKLYVESYKRIKEIKVIEEIVQDVFSCLWINRGAEEIKDLEACLNLEIKHRILKLYLKTGKFIEMKSN